MTVVSSRTNGDRRADVVHSGRPPAVGFAVRYYVKDPFNGWKVVDGSRFERHGAADQAAQQWVDDEGSDYVA